MRGPLFTTCSRATRKCEQRVDSDLFALSTRDLAEILEIPLHVVHVPIGKGGGFEWSVNVHESSATFPCTKGDSTLRKMSRLPDVLQFRAGCRSGGGVGASPLKISKAFFGSTLPILWSAAQNMDFDRHGGAKQRNLPWARRPKNEGCSPKLRRKLASHLPTQDPNNQADESKTPRWT